ncbi:zinc finger-containing ubiquitin peptidase 1-like isoform X2 [Planococcus citri]|uniref:zinc finger-containing ubiquitin peptidase 1-like isoform X2 n=1 Tax=Planococcus citri TaxID=170843 RepID=UPI0031F7B7EA
MSTGSGASSPNDLNSINNNVIENEGSNSSITTLHDGNFKRPNLELNLKPNEPKEIKCLICPYSHTSAKDVEKHINSEHFDGTSPSLPKEPSSSFNCPCCSESFQAYDKLESHVYYQHADNSDSKNSSTPCHKCPVCNLFTSLSSEELTEHVESHFTASSTTSPVSPDVTSDRLIAQKLSITDKENLQIQQQKEFEFLQAQYGMDNKGNFKEQSIKNMQKAVYSGELTVMDFYEKQNELKIAENIGLDDGSSVVKGIVPIIRSKSESCENVNRTYVCFNMDFYSATYGDRGWGCGYRNLQMLLSALWRNATYGELLNMQFCSRFGMEKMYVGNAMPSISKLQQLIEWAWEQGFDEEGRDQLGRKVHNTKKWIGATEVVTLLSALRFRCSLVDIHRANEKGQHPKMFEWILKYFQKVEEFKAPLYLQHDGHSQTVIGVEVLKDGEIFLLIVDPSTPRRQMEKLLSNNANQLGFLRKSLFDMKSDQYQIATVVGVTTSDDEYQASKILRPVRIM